MAPGEYFHDCSPEGTLVHRLGSLSIIGGDGITAIDCRGQGKVLNVNTMGEIDVMLSRLTFRHGSSRSNGGAVSVVKGGLSMQHCVFDDIESLASSLNAGSSIVALSSQGGGAVFISEATTLHIVNTSFLNCRAPNGSGGAILVRSKAGPRAQQITVRQGRFARCAAGTSGGAVSQVDMLGGPRAERRKRRMEGWTNRGAGALKRNRS
jgi:hypothetical protein